MNLSAIRALTFPPIEVEYTARDTILYALGTGFGAKPLDPDHLRFVYEDGLLAVPSFANVLASPPSGRAIRPMASTGSACCMPSSAW